MKKMNVFICLLLLLLSLKAYSQFITPFKIISPIEDTWVNENLPNKNNGDGKGHQCAKNDDDNNREVYIKYNIEDLPDYDSIVLSFHCGFTSYNDSETEGKEFVLQLLPVLEEWNEHNVTWGNKPKTFGKPLDEIKVTHEQKNYAFSSKKLKNHLDSLRNTNVQEVSFAIIGKNVVDGVTIWLHGKYWGFLNLECYYKHSKDLTLKMSQEPGCYEQDELFVSITPNEKSDVYYTLDGSMPNLKSHKYTKPLKLSSKTELTAIAFDKQRKSFYYQNFYVVNSPEIITATINASKETGRMQNFWNATGLSPAEILLEPDMRQACEYMGAIPNKGLVYVRPHYFLNLLAVEGIETATPVYNWTRLDSAMDILIENGLKPIFEIMGTPSSNLNEFSAGFDKNYQAQTESHDTYFTNFHEKEKVTAWKRMVEDLVTHFIERYGLEEVRSWYFESVNEPDYGSFWRHTEQEYLNYYDACSEALLEVDPQIRFGGPGTPGGLKSKYLKILLAHCDTGTNYFTGEIGSRIDFISIHVKDDPHTMVELELEAINYVKEHHPKFINLPFVNDEADPISGWRRSYWWRATPWHAAFVAQSIDLHYQEIIDQRNLKYAILSNDNAFLGSWLHRTQFARFVDEKNPSGFSLVKKPALTVFSMLSLMGNTMLDIQMQGDVPDNIGIMPTKYKDGKFAVVLYNKTDIDIPTKQKGEKEKTLLECGNEKINLKINNLPDNEYILVEYRIDEDHANPYIIWEEMGEPSMPNDQQLQKLREHQEIAIKKYPDELKVENGVLQQTIDMPASSVCLLMLVPKAPIVNISKIQGIRVNKYKNINGNTDILLRWMEPANNFIFTYEVWFSNDNKDFEKMNPTNFIDTGYLLTMKDISTKGYVKIRAVDYWGRKSPFSETIVLE